MGQPIQPDTAACNSRVLFQGGPIATMSEGVQQRLGRGWLSMLHPEVVTWCFRCGFLSG